MNNSFYHKLVLKIANKKLLNTRTSLEVSRTVTHTYYLYKFKVEKGTRQEKFYL